MKLKFICPHCHNQVTLKLNPYEYEVMHHDPIPCPNCKKPIVRGMLRRMEYFPNAYEKKPSKEK